MYSVVDLVVKASPLSKKQNILNTATHTYVAI